VSLLSVRTFTARRALFTVFGTKLGRGMGRSPVARDTADLPELCLVNIFRLSVVFNKKIGQRPHTHTKRTQTVTEEDFVSQIAFKFWLEFCFFFNGLFSLLCLAGDLCVCFGLLCGSSRGWVEPFIGISRVVAVQLGLDYWPGLHWATDAGWINKNPKRKKETPKSNWVDNFHPRPKQNPIPFTPFA